MEFCQRLKGRARKQFIAGWIVALFKAKGIFCHYLFHVLVILFDLLFVIPTLFDLNIFQNLCLLSRMNINVF